MGDKVNPKIVIHPEFEIYVFDKGKKGVLEPDDKVRFSYLDKKGKKASSCKTQKVSNFLKTGDCKQEKFRQQDKCSYPAHNGNDPADYFKAEALKQLIQGSDWEIRIKWSSKVKKTKLNSSYAAFLKKHLSERKPPVTREYVAVGNGHYGGFIDKKDLKEMKLPKGFKIKELSPLENSLKVLFDFNLWQSFCLKRQGKKAK